MDEEDLKQTVVEQLKAYRPAAHLGLFPHRRKFATPSFHKDIIEVWHSDKPKVVTEAFRSAAKSTLGEESVVLRAIFGEFKNCLIIGSTETRAMERLEAVKHEIELNEKITLMFGPQRGEVWSHHKALLRNGTLIQAVGVGQSVRGVKHHEHRPDFLWIDDIEDEESVRTADACKERLSWLYNTLIPVCAKGALIRMTGNRLSSESVIAKVSEDPNWYHQKFPVMYQELNTGEWTPAWPELYDLDWIESSRAESERMGLGDSWQQEYMCEAVAAHLKTFKPEHYRVVPQFRTWHPVMVMFDPARTTNKKSANTGKAVASWIGKKLVVWEATGKPLMPSELIDDIFATDIEYSPIVLGVEEDGLQEWLKEPLRMEQIKRRHMLPHLRPLTAPKTSSKDDFISAMQPYFHAGEVEFAKEMPELRKELLSFPSGRKDIINALAYFWRLRPGSPIYDSFDVSHVEEHIDPAPQLTKWLALNCDSGYVTAVLMQYDGGLEILADWIDDREPSQCVSDILKAAQLECGHFQVVAHPNEFNQWNNHGLVAALHRVPKRPTQGQNPESGRPELRFLLEHRTRSRPSLLVSSRASWTLRAFSGGYARHIDRRGIVEIQAEKNVYRTLMEGIECVAAILRQSADDEDREQSYRTSRDGRSYKSIIGR